MLSEYPSFDIPATATTCSFVVKQVSNGKLELEKENLVCLRNISRHLSTSVRFFFNSINDFKKIIFFVLTNAVYTGCISKNAQQMSPPVRVARESGVADFFTLNKLLK